MTEHQTTMLLLDSFDGSVLVPEPLRDLTHPEVIAWREWNRAQHPLDLSKVKTTSKEKFLARKRRQKGVAA